MRSNDFQESVTDDQEKTETRAAPPHPVFALRTIGEQAEVQFSSPAYSERKKWAGKQRTQKAYNKRVQATVNDYKKRI